jgi:hypothetical protein
LLWEWNWEAEQLEFNSINMDLNANTLHVIAGYAYYQISVLDGKIILSNDLKPALSKFKYYRIPKGQLPDQDHYIPIATETHLIFTQWDYMFFVNCESGEIEYYYQIEDAVFASHLYLLGDKLVVKVSNIGKNVEYFQSLKVYELPRICSAKSLTT